MRLQVGFKFSRFFGYNVDVNYGYDSIVRFGCKYQTSAALRLNFSKPCYDLVLNSGYDSVVNCNLLL